MVCFWCFVLFVPAICPPWPKAWVAEWVQSQHWTESHDLSRQAAGWSKKAKDGRIFFRILWTFFADFVSKYHWTFALGLRSWLRAWFAHGLCPRNVGIHWLQCWTALSWMGYWWVSFRPEDFRFSRYFSSFFFNQDFLSFGSRFFCMVVMVQEVLAIHADCGGAGRHCTGWQQLWLQATPREHRHWGVTDLALKVSSKQQKKHSQKW